MDVIIVNNDVGNTEGNRFLKSLNNQKIFRGRIKYLERENSGMCFGAYSTAYKVFKNSYQYFLFCEDDNVIYKKNYLKDGIDLFEKSEKCGFVPYVHSTKLAYPHRKILKLTQSESISCHGFLGLTSTYVLNKILDESGDLPFNNRLGENYCESIIKGEIALSLKIIRQGFKIFDFPKDAIMSEPAYDLMRGIQYKKWPNFIEKLKFDFKTFLYSIFSVNHTSLKKYYKFLDLINKK